MSVNSYKLGFASSRLRRTTVHLQFVLTLLLIILLSYSLWRRKDNVRPLPRGAGTEWRRGYRVSERAGTRPRAGGRGPGRRAGAEAANDDPSCGFVGGR